VPKQGGAVGGCTGHRRLTAAKEANDNKRSGVEPTRIELVTSSMPWMRSPS
jgi:hypothetical protein